MVPVQSVIAILRFYSELCSVNNFKNWMGTDGCIFWLPILSLLSTLPGSLKSSFFGTQAYELESVVISYLARCCWSHPENQSIIAKCLCEIVLKQKITPHSEFHKNCDLIFAGSIVINIWLDLQKQFSFIQCQHFAEGCLFSCCWRTKK